MWAYQFERTLLSAYFGDSSNRAAEQHRKDLKMWKPWIEKKKKTVV